MRLSISIRLTLDSLIVISLIGNNEGLLIDKLLEHILTSMSHLTLSLESLLFQECVLLCKGFLGISAPLIEAHG